MGKKSNINYLINRGADIEAKRYDGSTPLHEGIFINVLNIYKMKFPFEHH